MFRRDRARSHATPTARARRIREAARREQELRAQGIDPVAYERDRAAIRSGRASEARSFAAVGVRRRPPIGRILLVGVVLLLTVAVVGGVLVWQRVAAFNDTVSTEPAASSRLFGPLNGDERVNVVLLGYGGPTHQGGSFLADSIQILSIDPRTDTTTIIPVPRDLWVEGLPQMPNNGKINEAFAIAHRASDGSIEEAAAFTTEVLSAVTGLRIDHWMAMDFAGFREMVDAVGGVTVQNPVAFSYTWNETSFHNGVFDAGAFEAGTLHLNGEEALSYARSRYTSVPAESSDFARSVRQQRVLSALRSKLGDGGLSSIGPGLAMMDALAGRMRTNLSAIDLFLLSGHLNPDRRLELKEGVILEATTNTIGQYILVVIGRASSTDYTPLQEFIRSELAKPIPTPTPSPSSPPPPAG
ncbi:MAG TPA: LCP family protein [candidate division Zixibacteria bacterium]|nr:LCP family protein [candidate division Zixibacteria bacterium]